MNLQFDIKNQKIVLVDNKYVVSDSKEYLTAEFCFSGDWLSYTKTVIFKGVEGAFSVKLEENQCIIPHEVLSGRFGVSVFGVAGNSRITTDTVYINVHPSGYEDGKTPEAPTPTVYERILQDLDATQINIEYPTGTDIILAHNTEVRLGEVEELNLTLPLEPPENFISSAVFTSGEIPTNLAYPDTIHMNGEDCIDGIFVPIDNKRYNMFVSFDGEYYSGIVGGFAI